MKQIINNSNSLYVKKLKRRDKLLSTINGSNFELRNQ